MRREDTSSQYHELVLVLRGLGATACAFFAVGTILMYTLGNSTEGALWSTAAMAVSFLLATRRYE